MNDASREQILADFQDCTGLENVEECISFLQKNQWNLLHAVQALHTQIGGGSAAESKSSVTKNSTAAASSTSSTQRKPTTTHTSPSVMKKPAQNNSSVKRYTHTDEIDDADEPKIIRSVPAASKAIKGASGTTHRGTGRELHFTIEYKDQTDHLTILENETVHKLQSKIAEKLHVPISRQKFSNWSSKQYDEHTHLKDLQLPKENTLHLISTGSTHTNGATRSSTTTTHAAASRVHRHPASSSEKHSTAASADYLITVLCEDRAGKATPYELLMTPTITIGEIKKEIERVAHIPLRQQGWSGLNGAKDSDEFRRTSINRKGQLSVRKIEPASNQQTPVIRRDTKHSTAQRHKSEDEFMDVDPPIDLGQFDDDIGQVPQYMSGSTTASSYASNRELLIPERCTDDVAGLEHFNRVFHARYGSTGPILYIGPLEEAIQKSVSASRDERRPLAIYLHNDRSVCANVFCAQVLAGETIVEYLANNYVVWAWDLTSDANRTRLLETFKRCLGPSNAQKIVGMDKDAFPLILVLSRSHGSLELLHIIEGNCTPSEVLLQLIQSHETFEQQRQRDAKEEAMRETRENLKRQQEDEYHQSLQADKAKEEARLAEEKRQQAERHAAERLKQERLKEQEQCKARLPKEPNESEKDITRFKIRLPNDEGILMRRFRIKDTLQTMFDYLSSQGHIFGDYKLLSTYPKRDLTTLNRADTFEQLKLFPQEQLILENL